MQPLKDRQDQLFEIFGATDRRTNDQNCKGARGGRNVAAHIGTEHEINEGVGERESKYLDTCQCEKCVFEKNPRFHLWSYDDVEVDDGAESVVCPLSARQLMMLGDVYMQEGRAPVAVSLFAAAVMRLERYYIAVRDETRIVEYGNEAGRGIEIDDARNRKESGNVGIYLEANGIETCSKSEEAAIRRNRGTGNDDKETRGVTYVTQKSQNSQTSSDAMDSAPNQFRSNSNGVLLAVERINDLVNDVATAYHSLGAALLNMRGPPISITIPHALSLSHLSSSLSHPHLMSSGCSNHSELIEGRLNSNDRNSDTSSNGKKCHNINSSDSDRNRIDCDIGGNRNDSRYDSDRGHINIDISSSSDRHIRALFPPMPASDSSTLEDTSSSSSSSSRRGSISDWGVGRCVWRVGYHRVKQMDAIMHTHDQEKQIEGTRRGEGKVENGSESSLHLESSTVKAIVDPGPTDSTRRDCAFDILKEQCLKLNYYDFDKNCYDSRCRDATSEGNASNKNNVCGGRGGEIVHSTKRSTSHVPNYDGIAVDKKDGNQIGAVDISDSAAEDRSVSNMHNLEERDGLSEHGIHLERRLSAAACSSAIRLAEEYAKGTLSSYSISHARSLEEVEPELNPSKEVLQNDAVGSRLADTSSTSSGTSDLSCSAVDMKININASLLRSDPSRTTSDPGLESRPEPGPEPGPGWTTNRHYGVPTTDIPLHSIPQLLLWFNGIMRDRISRDLRDQFMGGKGRVAVHDAFIVKYHNDSNDIDAQIEAATSSSSSSSRSILECLKNPLSSSQRYLPLHTDESTHSLIIALNPTSEYEGGGTFFADLQRAIRPGKCVIHPLIHSPIYSLTN